MPKQDNTPQYTGRSYTIYEWCAIRRVSRNTAYDLIRTGELKSYKIGQRRYISDYADREFVQRREAQASA